MPSGSQACAGGSMGTMSRTQSLCPTDLTLILALLLMYLLYSSCKPLPLSEPQCPPV